MSNDLDYYAVEGSNTIVDSLHKRFPELKDKIVCCDFSKEIPFDISFDMIFDRAAITHNTTADIKKTISHIYDHLKDNGQFMGIDWFSMKDDGYKYGKDVEDVYTKIADSNSRFAGLGNTHFSDEKHLKELFQKFTFEYLQEKETKEYIPKTVITGKWDFVVRK